MVHDPQIGQALRGQREVGRIWKVHEGPMFGSEIRELPTSLRKGNGF